MDVLTETEEAQLQACEAVISMGWQSLVEVGLAPAQIRDHRLYKNDFNTCGTGLYAFDDQSSSGYSVDSCDPTG